MGLKRIESSQLGTINIKETNEPNGKSDTREGLFQNKQKNPRLGKEATSSSGLSQPI